SSMGKGESFRDTLLTMSYMGTDAIVMRHSAEGAPLYATKAVDPIIINAGDGAHEHPTQALLDMYSILEKKESLEGLKVVIIGDIMHSRVARSNIYGLTKMGADVHLAGPRTMVYPELEKLGVTVHHDIREAVANADVVNVLRIQLERIHSALYPTNREYARIFGINNEVLKLAKDDVMVMHPGPMNRGLEIAPDVAYSDQSVIQEQVRNGVAVRMAVLYLTIIGGDGSELAY
ncbi:MAG: aspartate carbamoyltransferase catalytic subunit, partial [Veillonella sp.]|nr:aspartate carbamoyltransferase catalytic subunit [Veillonella sp.]